MCRRHAILLLWIAGLVAPAAWLAYRIPAIGRWFDRLFGSPTAHVGMHALLFAVLALLLVRTLKHPLRPTPWVPVLSIVLVVALLQESIQLATKARAPFLDDLTDVGVDLAGAIVALMLHQALGSLRRPR